MLINATDNHDSGYIITDYRSVETEYGFVEDVRTLVRRRTGEASV